MHNASSIVGPKQVSSGIFGLVILDLGSLQERLHTKRIYFLFAFCRSGSVVGPLYLCLGLQKSFCHLYQFNVVQY